MSTSLDPWRCWRAEQSFRRLPPLAGYRYCIFPASTHLRSRQAPGTIRVAKAMLEDHGSCCLLLPGSGQISVVGLLLVYKSGLRPRPLPWRAPTWSWASVNAPNGVVFVRIAGWSRSVALERDITAVQGSLPPDTILPARFHQDTSDSRQNSALAYVRYSCHRCSSIQQLNGHMYIESLSLEKRKAATALFAGARTKITEPRI